MWIGTAAQCREIDRYAIEELGISPTELMENAGKAVFETVMALAPGGSVMVACGPGNNGGDGLVAARLLDEAGADVCAFIAGVESKLSDGCKTQLTAARKAGIEIVFHGEPGWDTLEKRASDSTVIVDGLLGTGQIGEPSGAVREAVLAIGNSYGIIVSIDVPTGIMTDSGDAPGAFVDADATVSFELAKPCFFQGTGAEACGDWVVVDIGVPEEAFQESTGFGVLDAPTMCATLGVREIDSHKGENGHVLIVAGSYRMRGAAALAALGALHAGAGMVTVAGVSEVCDTVAIHVPEALLMPLDDEDDGVLAPDAADQLLEFQDRYRCAVFGPGLTTHESTRGFLARMWDDWSLPSVIDADALNALSLGLELPDAPCVLTPHPGEMARLLGMSSEKIQADRFGSVLEAVEKYDRTVLLKGAYSVIGEPDANVLVNASGNPGMATAGMGDVLAGVVAGLLAQGLPTLQASAIGAHLHGLAGDICAAEIGPVGFLASDVAAAIPAARAKLEECYED